MARTADFQRIVTEEISVELADGVSSIQVKERLDVARYRSREIWPLCRLQ